MTNDIYSNATWSRITLCIYLLPTHSPIYLTNYLFTYYPPTYYLPTYLSTYVPIFFHFGATYLLIYLPTYLHITYLPIHHLPT